MVEVAEATKFAEFCMEKSVPGVEVPTPTRPAFVTVKCEMVDEPMAKDGAPSVVVLIIETSIANLPHGVEVPKPTLPLAFALKIELNAPLCVEEAEMANNTLLEEVWLSTMVSWAYGVEVPRPTKPENRLVPLTIN